MLSRGERHCTGTLRQARDSHRGCRLPRRLHCDAGLPAVAFCAVDPLRRVEASSAPEESRAWPLVCRRAAGGSRPGAWARQLTAQVRRDRRTAARGGRAIDEGRAGDSWLCRRYGRRREVELRAVVERAGAALLVVAAPSLPRVLLRWLPTAARRHAQVMPGALPANGHRDDLRLEEAVSLRAALGRGGAGALGVRAGQRRMSSLLPECS